MGRKIRLLGEHIANKIAAGEVIERPASVVKELVENSIDAESTKITIKFDGCGATKISILDNGIGMSALDTTVAFSRHATSKIDREDDLNRIHTLGFRGEALPSIASVSKVKLISRRKKDLEGSSIYLEGGKIIEQTTIGCPVGTTIIMEELFFNVPARKKYLKKPSTEAQHIINIAQRLALAHPKISFRLFRNGQQVFMTNGSGELADVIAEIYGLEHANAMIPLELKDAKIKIKGLISKSYFHRSTRNQQTFIVNGRYVKNSLIQSTLENTYRTLLPINRYPIAVIEFRLSPHDVDVNVHPTKSEIKFAKPTVVENALTDALESALLGVSHIPKLEVQDRQEKENILEIKENREEYVQPEFPNFNFISVPNKEQDHGTSNNRTLLDLEYRDPINGGGKNPSFPLLKAIGQLNQTFILAQGVEGLYIIDQHGAHERINYEFLQQQIKEKPIFGQALAVPYTLELNSAEQEVLVEHMVTLTEFGIIVEYFGQNTFLVRTAPPELKDLDMGEIIFELLSAWEGVSSDAYSMENRLDDGLKLLACKQAIKANRLLSSREQQLLIDDLSQLNSPFTCPHGRPIITSLNYRELERRLGRK